MTWIKAPEKTHPLVRLSEISLRLQRITLINKIQTINTLMAMHTPKLQKHRKGKETLAEAQRYAAKLLRTLQEQLPKEVDPDGQ